MNAVQLLGNLGRDPIIRATRTGRAVASFSLAVSRDYTTPQGEQRELTDWINIVAWGQLAEAVRSELKKGSRVFVAGRRRTEKQLDALRAKGGRTAQAKARARKAAQ